jgi:hypothetical protein
MEARYARPSKDSAQNAQVKSVTGPTVLMMLTDGRELLPCAVAELEDYELNC